MGVLLPDVDDQAFNAKLRSDLRPLCHIAPFSEPGLFVDIVLSQLLSKLPVPTPYFLSKREDMNDARIKSSASISKAVASSTLRSLNILATRNPQRLLPSRPAMNQPFPFVIQKTLRSPQIKPENVEETIYGNNLSHKYVCHR
ncbi:hypothetical protein K4K61_005054 [Colletotrichum sp. SAR11_59]|nr:hypothetical protein K4K61_005054 [Colletotrichum sp. SAR11_59]